MSFEPLPIPESVTLAAQLIVALAMFLSFCRIIMGPSVADRIVALDLLAALIMVQCVILVMTSGFIGFLDIATAIAIITFIATIALSLHLSNTKS